MDEPLVYASPVELGPADRAAAAGTTRTEIGPVDVIAAGDYVPRAGGTCNKAIVNLLAIELRAADGIAVPLSPVDIAMTYGHTMRSSSH